MKGKARGTEPWRYEDGLSGDVGIVLTATRPKKFDPDDFGSYVQGSFKKVPLLQIEYNPGNGWKTVDARGLFVGVNPALHEAALREFNPCHDPKDGKFSGKGRGNCQPVTPDKVYEKQRKYAVLLTKDLNREVAWTIDEKGKQLPYPYPKHHKDYYTQEDAGNDWLRAEVAREGYTLGLKGSVIMPKNWRDARHSTFFHTHPEGATFSPGDWKAFIEHSKSEAMIVFGPNGEWYEARKSPDTNLDAPSVEELTRVMEAARDRWRFDSAAALFKEKGYPVRKVGLDAYNVSWPDGKHYLTLREDNASEKAIDILFKGDGYKTSVAARKALDHRPVFHDAVKQWAKNKKGLMYRSWYDVQQAT